MNGALAVLLLLSSMFGRGKGLLGGLAGGFIGALVFAGIARTARNGELAALYSPGELASAALAVAVVTVLLALVAPYATGIASLGWSAGSVFAALAAPGTGQAEYLLPLALHFVSAAAVLCVARWRAAALQREANRKASILHRYGRLTVPARLRNLGGGAARGAFAAGVHSE